MRDLQAARGTALSVGRRALLILACGIWLFGLSVDQLVKLASVTYLNPGEPVPLIGDIFRLHLIRNPGAAFGMGSGATIIFSIFAIAATIACLWVVFARQTRLWHGVTLGLLLAGITGNLIDRIFQPPAPLHGHVIDMFQLKYFAIFNVADVCLTVGALLVVVFSLKAEREDA